MNNSSKIVIVALFNCYNFMRRNNVNRNKYLPKLNLN